MKVHLKPNEEIRLNQGHAWVYHNEIQSFEGVLQSGEMAEVYSHKGQFIGKGILNTASKIMVRILSRNKTEVIDQSWFEKRLLAAFRYRQEQGYTSTYRLVFAEADGLPGLVIDRYEDVFVLQITSLGMDVFKTEIIQALLSLFPVQGILERGDLAVRKKEGLPEVVSVLYGDVPQKVIIQEGQVSFFVYPFTGQKTGTFLDQVQNHLAIEPYVKNKVVLDCFSHIGGFGLQACYYQAKEVSMIELSKSACEQIQANILLNQFTQARVIQGDVFQSLRQFVQNKQTFDTIILDPPAFTKNQEGLAKAYSGYKEINLQAMKCINNGGYLITCSCSHYMTPALFLAMLQEAAKDSQRSIQMVEFRTQGKDHPTLLGLEESLYLKCVIVRVSDYV